MLQSEHLFRQLKTRGKFPTQKFKRLINSGQEETEGESLQKSLHNPTSFCLAIHISDHPFQLLNQCGCFRIQLLWLHINQERLFSLLLNIVHNIASAISAPEAIHCFCSLIISNNRSKMRTEERPKKSLPHLPQSASSAQVEI